MLKDSVNPAMPAVRLTSDIRDASSVRPKLHRRSKQRQEASRARCQTQPSVKVGEGAMTRSALGRQKPAPSLEGWRLRNHVAVRLLVVHHARCLEHQQRKRHVVSVGDDGHLAYADAGHPHSRPMLDPAPEVFR